MEKHRSTIYEIIGLIVYMNINYLTINERNFLIT